MADIFVPGMLGAVVVVTLVDKVPVTLGMLSELELILPVTLGMLSELELILDGRALLAKLADVGKLDFTEFRLFIVDNVPMFWLSK